MAATIIDALIVTLGLDASKFKEGQNQASDSTKKFKEQQDQASRAIAANAKAMADGFKSVRNELMGLIAVGLGATGFKSFIESQVKGQAQLGYLSKNLGVQARELDAWGKAAKSVGGTADDVLSSFQGLAGGLEQFKLTGESSVVSALSAIKVKIGDENGLFTPDKIFKSIAKSEEFKKLTPQDQIYFAQQAGVSDKGLLLLQKGGDELEALLKKYEQASNVTQESTKRAQEAQAAWADFTSEVNGVGQAIFNSMAPALVEATQELAKLGKWVNEHHEEIGGFFTGLVKDAKDLTVEVKELDSATEGWTTKLGAAAAAILLLGGRFKWLGGLAARSPYLLMLALKGDKSDATKQAEAAQQKAMDGDRKAAEDLARKQLANNPLNWFRTITEEEVQKRADSIMAGEQAGIPRGFRNKNPGNLNFAGQAGATLETGVANPRFAKFNTMEEGVAALGRQLKLYESRGINTIREIVNKYAPASDNNDTAAYMKHLSKATGAGIDQPLNLSDSEQLVALTKGIIKRESGGLPEELIRRGLGVGAAPEKPSKVADAVARGMESLGDLVASEMSAGGGAPQRDSTQQLQEERRAVQPPRDQPQQRARPQPQGPVGVFPAKQQKNDLPSALAELISALKPIPLSPREMPIGAAASSMNNGSTMTTSTTQNEVHIGQLIVQTQATDAQSIASDLPRQLEQNALINLAATGMR